ncbi:MAG: TolC family protein [Gemmatimonadetes bacterium]|nr:TolC family protein [Gemmatimonadota bacterium]
MKMLVKGVTMALAMTLTMTLAPVALSAQVGGEARAISLDEAVRLAQLNQPSTIQARNALRTGAGNVRQARFNLGYIPTLGISTGATQRGGERYAEGVKLPTTPNPWSYSRGLNIGAITLFDGGQRWNNYRTQQSNLTASEATLISQQYNVALSVKTSYYAVLTAREQESAAQRQLEQAEQQLRVSTAKINAGSATRTDSLSGAIAVGNARQAILTAQNQLRNANAQLTRYVATPFTVTATAADTSDIAPIELDETSLVAMALEGPAVRQADAQVSAQQAAARGARAPYMPTLSMTMGYGLTVDNSAHYQWGAPSGNSTSLGFNLNYTLFNNFQREQQIITTRVGVENAEANLRDQKFLAQQNLTTFLNNFSTATLTIELNKLQIQAAEENLRVVQQQYNLGTKQLLDLLTAQTSLDNARTSLITSRQNARLAKANIESLIGRDLK